MQNNTFSNLLETLQPYKNTQGFNLIIQTHDYPDPDAIAAGFALSYLLQQFGYKSTLCYEGKIQNFSVETALVEFEVDIRKFSKQTINENTKIILVDCYVGNKNITTHDEKVIGLIDHHRISKSNTVAFEDVRSDYGSSSTIMYTYFLETKIIPPKNISSMLMMGMIIDTSYFTRGVSEIDFIAYYYLYLKADHEKVLLILKNSMSISYLSVFKEAIESFEIDSGFCFIYIKNKNIAPEVLAIVADFFIELKEVDFVVVLGYADGAYRISARSFSTEYPASTIISKSLDGIGQGGGHYHMGGGTIKPDMFEGEKSLKEKFFEVYKSFHV